MIDRKRPADASGKGQARENTGLDGVPDRVEPSRLAGCRAIIQSRAVWRISRIGIPRATRMRRSMLAVPLADGKHDPLGSGAIRGMSVYGAKGRGQVLAGGASQHHAARRNLMAKSRAKGSIASVVRTSWPNLRLISRKWVSLSFPQFGEIGGYPGCDDGVVGGRSDGHRLLDEAVKQEAAGL